MRGKKKKLEVSHSPTSDYTIKPQSSKQTGTKQTHRWTEQNREPRNRPAQAWSVHPQKRRQSARQGKDSLCKKCCLENGTATCNRMRLEHFLSSFTNANSKWIKDLRSETIKLLRAQTEHPDINQSSVSLDLSPTAKEIK